MCAAAPPSSLAAQSTSRARRRGKRSSTINERATPDGHPSPVARGSTDLRFDPQPRQAPSSGLPTAKQDGVFSLLDRFSLVDRANVGDHAAIGQLLSVVFPGYTSDDFLTTLEDPLYEPTDRLLVKRIDRVLAQLHLTRREMLFGDCRIPVAGLFQLGTLPEFRGRGFAGKLLAAAQRKMAADGASVGLLCTSIPHFFRPAGWAVCGRHSHWRVGARDLLAQLAGSSQRRPREQTISVRPWRQVELPALIRLYAQHTRGAVGPYARGEAYWRWLLGRQGYDQIYVAIRGPDKLDLEQYDQDGSQSSLVGYAVTKDDRILELVISPGHRTAARRLLARAAREVIERDHHALTWHAMPYDPLCEFVAGAGGALHHHESHQGDVLMATLMDPIGFLDSLCPVLHQRACASRLSRPCELGLLVEGEKFRLVLSRRSVKLRAKKVGRSYLSCNWAEFTRLVLGHLDLSEATASGRLEASTRVALETARTIFPKLPFWRPPWDDQLP